MAMLKQYRPLEKNEFIVIGGDCSCGGDDFSCCQFLSKTRLDVPMVYHSPVLSTAMTNEVYPILEKIFDVTGIKPLIAYERNNGGLFEMERLATMNRLGKFDLFKMPHAIGKDVPVNPMQDVKYGWDTNSATRSPMLANLKEAIDKKLLTIYDQRTIEEMFSFIISQTSTSWKAQAEHNAHDDCVMALAIAWQLYLMSDNPIPPKKRTDRYGITDDDDIYDDNTNFMTV